MNHLTIERISDNLDQALDLVFKRNIRKAGQIVNQAFSDIISNWADSHSSDIYHKMKILSVKDRDFPYDADYINGLYDGILSLVHQPIVGVDSAIDIIADVRSLLADWVRFR